MRPRLFAFNYWVPQIFILSVLLGVASQVTGCAAAEEEPADDRGAPSTAVRTTNGDSTDGTDTNDEEPQAKDDKEEEEKLQVLKLADDRLILQMPERWERQEPGVRIIEVELTVPATDEEVEPGRLTIMQAGGTIEANVDRWIGQFTQPDGSSSREAAKIEEKEYDGLAVHRVDIAGKFLDIRGPFAREEKDDYRMLAAIIETDGAGNYFVKFAGPQETVEENAEAFWRAIEGLQWE